MNKSKTVLITGASSGIGRELSLCLAKQGYELILVGRNTSKLTEYAQSLEKIHSIRTHVITANLAEISAAHEIFNYTQNKHLKVDCLINNAGVGLYDEHIKLNIDELHDMLQLNVVTLSKLCLLFGKQMKENGAGKILNIASTAAYQPTPFFSAYGASKAYVLNFSEALAKELEDHGVVVSCLSPGPTDTAFFENMQTNLISNQHPFTPKNRVSVSKVAQKGLELLESGGLSTIVGFQNQFLVFLNRFVPRNVVATIAKKMMAPR